MKISYELNPPKILIDEDHFDVMRLNQELQILLNRSSELVNLVNGIHLTDSVLGIPRVSSITAASYIKKIQEQEKEEEVVVVIIITIIN
jgi:hypothetical protein